MVWSFRSIVVLAIFAVILTGCSAFLPRQELQDFRTAFLEAQRAGDLLYDEISIIIDETEGSSSACGRDRTGAPTCFDPSQVTSETQRHEHPSVRARRLALELVSEYTLALVDVAEGKSSSELKSNIVRVADLARSVVGIAGASSGGIPALLAGPVVSTFADFAGQLESARSAANIRQSIIVQQQTVAELIDVLIADTEVMYRIYYRHRQVRTLQLPGLQAEQEMQKAADYHEALTAYVLILKQAKATHERLIEAARRPVTGLGDVRVIIEEAIRIKTTAQAFWNAIRDVRG